MRGDLVEGARNYPRKQGNGSITNLRLVVRQTVVIDGDVGERNRFFTAVVFAPDAAEKTRDLKKEARIEVIGQAAPHKAELTDKKSGEERSHWSWERR